MVLHSKLRSWLTILGIVIGVAAVIAIMSLGAGLTQAVNNQLGNLGGDIVTLTAGAERGGNIFVQRERVNYFLKVFPMLQASANLAPSFQYPLLFMSNRKGLIFA